MRTVVGLTTGLNVSWKSIPSYWWNPLTTSRAFMAIDEAIGILFESKNPFITHKVLRQVWQYKNPCIILNKSIKLFGHSCSPLRYFHGLGSRGGFNRFRCGGKGGDRKAGIGFENVMLGMCDNMVCGDGRLRSGGHMMSHRHLRQRMITWGAGMGGTRRGFVM